MKLTPRFLRFGLLLAALRMSGCNNNSVPVDPRKTFIILVDRSASVNKGQSTAYLGYLDQFVLPSLTPGSAVIAMPIVGSGTGRPEPALKEDLSLPELPLPASGWTRFFIGHDNSYDPVCGGKTRPALESFIKSRNDLGQAVKALIRYDAASQHTFLLDAIREASSAIKTDQQPRVIVVLTDGLEDSDEFGPNTNFGSLDFWRKRRPIDLVGHLHMDEFAGLRGASVYMYGVGHANSKIRRNVTDFWTDFFKAAGAASERVGQWNNYNEKPFLPDSGEKAIDAEMDKICGEKQPGTDKGTAPPAQNLRPE